MADLESTAATYVIVPQPTGAFGVEVTIPGASPTMVTSFETEAAAELWIAGHRQRAENPPKKLPFRKRK